MAEPLAPPVARPRSSPDRDHGDGPSAIVPLARRLPTRPSTIAFATALGREDRLPTPRRPRSARSMSRPGSSHRRLIGPGAPAQGPKWQFLTKTTAEEAAAAGQGLVSARSTRNERLRPATARCHRSSLQGESAPTVANSSEPVEASGSRGWRSRRPATCRGSRSSIAGELTVTQLDPSILQEAARRETEQEAYVNPLIGRSVERRHTRYLAEAHRSYDAVVTNAISAHEGHRIRAFRARRDGDLLGAIKYYEQLLEVVPTDGFALFQLAVAYEKTGQWMPALATYHRVMAIDSENPFLHYNIGNLYMKLDRVTDAIGAYTKAIDSSGSGKCQNLAFYRQRGAAYRKNGDFEKAAQDYARLKVVRRRRNSMTTEESIPNARVDDDGLDDLHNELDDAGYSAKPLYTQTTQPLFSSEVASIETPWNHRRANANQAVGSGSAPLEAWRHHKLAEVLRKHQNPQDRSEADIWLIVDELQRLFPMFSCMDTGACKYLASKLTATIDAPGGTMLFQEHDSGGFAFFVIRGTLTSYKRIVQLFDREISSPENNPAEDHDGGHDHKNPHTRAEDVIDHLLTWESIRLSMSDDAQQNGSLASARSVVSMLSPAAVAKWSRVQAPLTTLSVGDVCGLHGRMQPGPRSYSVLVSESSDFLSIAWEDLAEAERLHRLARSEKTARFFETMPLFHGLPKNELRHLAELAKNYKVVGPRVLCTEGQHVNGIIVVREGALCQLHPSELTRPPNLAVAFALSGTVAINGEDPDHSGRHFFTQLEFADDPLHFLHDSELMHGFLPSDYLRSRLDAFSAQGHAGVLPTLASAHPNGAARSATTSGDPAVPQESDITAMPTHTACSLGRCGFFSASSAWIPPRRASEAGASGGAGEGVACAKSALIAVETSEILFLTPTDVLEALSSASRSLLHANMQLLTRRRRHVPPTTPGERPPQTALSRFVFLKPPSGEDLVHRYRHDNQWRGFKEELVTAILEAKRATRPRSMFHRDPSARPIRKLWKR